MKPPVRVAANALGEFADVRDADDRSVAFCVEPADAMEVVRIVNGYASLRAALSASAAEASALRRFLRRFSQTAAWHAERKRLMVGPDEKEEST